MKNVHLLIHSRTDFLSSQTIMFNVVDNLQQCNAQGGSAHEEEGTNETPDFEHEEGQNQIFEPEIEHSVLQNPDTF